MVGLCLWRRSSLIFIFLQMNHRKIWIFESKGVESRRHLKQKKNPIDISYCRCLIELKYRTLWMQHTGSATGKYIRWDERYYKKYGKYTNLTISHNLKSLVRGQGLKPRGALCGKTQQTTNDKWGRMEKKAKKRQKNIQENTMEWR